MTVYKGEITLKRLANKTFGFFLLNLGPRSFDLLTVTFQVTFDNS